MRDRVITETILWHARIAGIEDSHGNSTETWAAPVDLGIWRYAPGGTSEPRLPGQERVITEPTIYLPLNDIGAHDQITARGIRHEVQGDPAEWVDGTFTGCVIELRRVTG